MSTRELKFPCPENGVPCIAIYDEEGETLTFTVEEGAEFHHLQSEIDEANKFCMYGAINCDNIHHANRHLLFLEVEVLFETDDNVTYVVEKFDH